MVAALRVGVVEDLGMLGIVLKIYGSTRGSSPKLDTDLKMLVSGRCFW
jgi:hypothetical protein